MPEATDFAQRVEQAAAVPGRAHMRPVIEKELLHYDIMHGLAEAGLLDALTFQGGTALRLCYGAARFSEDLDFVGGPEFAASDWHGITACLERCIRDRYGLEVKIQEPRAQDRGEAPAGIRVARWRIAVTTAPRRKDLPKQRLKLEVASIPAYSREVRALQCDHYAFLPDGYGDTLVCVESLDEMMADKLVALVNVSRQVRYRDIWDLGWLKRKGAAVRGDWVRQKVRDYRVADYPAKLDAMARRLPDLVRSETFAKTLSRFVPEDVQARTLRKGEFQEYLAHEAAALLRDAGQAV